MTINVFLSFPMSGKTDEELFKEKERLEKTFLNEYTHKFPGVDIKFLDHYNLEMPGGASQSWYLAQDIDVLGKADIIYFGDGYQNASGCVVELMAAMKFGVSMHYENFPISHLDFSFMFDQYYKTMAKKEENLVGIIADQLYGYKKEGLS